MDPTTTPEPVTPPVGADTAQPAEPATAAVIETTSETPTDPTPAEPATAAPAEDEDPSEYWTKKGIDITTPEGQAKAAKSYQEAEKAMHQKGQQASELTKQLTTKAAADPDASDSQKALAIATQLQNAEVIRQWKAETGVTQDEDNAMGAYAKANPETAELLNSGLITLDQFKAMSVPTKAIDTAAIKTQGGQEALEKLANKQRATQPTGNASTQTKAPAGNSLDELKSRLAGVTF